ncbi:SiaB family protein kinase [Cupriavidus sp. 2TAF22]|uniref:SiaB family protein kinase n=1 Tax=unclassified Cupriavidus TaxID=2640874 RepID=UPI003F929876
MSGTSIDHEYGAFFEMARERNVIFYYVGYFSQNIIAAMSDAVRLQLAVSGVDNGTRRKLFSSFVEMAQNIVHYSSDALTPPTQDTNQLRHGSVCISMIDERYRLMCSNPVAISRVAQLRAALEPLRTMTLDQIKQAYKETMRAEAPEGSKGAGLGFLTVARDASAPLEYNFQPIDADPASTMFHLVATI